MGRPMIPLHTCLLSQLCDKALLHLAFEQGKREPGGDSRPHTELRLDAEIRPNPYCPGPHEAQTVFNSPTRQNGTHVKARTLVTDSNNKLIVLAEDLDENRHIVATVLRIGYSLAREVVEVPRDHSPQVFHLLARQAELRVDVGANGFTLAHDRHD